jgi:hypothetical protein
MPIQPVFNEHMNRYVQMVLNGQRQQAVMLFFVEQQPMTMAGSEKYIDRMVERYKESILASMDNAASDYEEAIAASEIFNDL